MGYRTPLSQSQRFWTIALGQHRSTGACATQEQISPGVAGAKNWQLLRHDRSGGAPGRTAGPPNCRMQMSPPSPEQAHEAIGPTGGWDGPGA